MKCENPKKKKIHGQSGRVQEYLLNLSTIEPWDQLQKKLDQELRK